VSALGGITGLEIPVDPGVLVDGELRLTLTEFTYHVIHKVPTYHFRMVNSATDQEFGGIRLRLGSTPHIERYAGHIGYNVLPRHRGHHYAARSVRLLVPLSRRLGIDPLWITCDPQNHASRRTLEIVGAKFVEIVEVPLNCVIRQTGHPRKCRYRL
jgi:predicted acetyltransferase